MGSLIAVGVFLFLGLFVGGFNERRHYKSLRERERATRSLKLDNCKKVVILNESVLEQRLVIGSTVVSIDYFKLIITGIKSLFGGKLRGVESLLERARREAVLRMKEEVPDFSMITNVKIETSSISKDIAKNHVGSVEIIAYGTAIKMK